MFRHLLRRRARRSHASLIPARASHRDKPRPWRRPLAWAALITLVASALYFSVADRTEPGAPPSVVH